MDHRGEHCHVHEVARVHDLPCGAHPGIDQQVMRRRHRDEQDVEHEGRAADLLVEDNRADRQRAEHVPDGDHGGDVDLLGRVAEAPPDHPVDLRVHIHQTQRPEVGRDVDHSAVHEGDDGDDGRRHRAVNDERQRASVGLLPPRHDQVREEDTDRDERADREEDHAEVERRLRAQRHVRREQDIRPAGPHHRLDRERSGEHQGESSPGDLRRAVACVQQHGAGEDQHRHLEEDDEENQHAHPVHAEDAVEPHGREQVDSLPARQHDEHRGNRTDQQRDHRGNGVHLDQTLRAKVDAPSRGRARSKDVPPGRA